MPLKIEFDWEFRAVNPPEDKPHLRNFRPASVPGLIQIDLIKYGDIPEPFINDNYKNHSWMAGVQWEYSTTLPEIQKDKKCTLIFEGIDTLASIALNGEDIAITENMHRSYEIDLTGQLKQTENRLTVTIDCPVKHAETLCQSSSCKVVKFQCQGKPVFYYPYIRKAAYSAGWDWLAYLHPSIGIWKPAFLLIEDSIFTLKSVLYEKKLRPDLKHAEITAHIEIIASENLTLLATLSVDLFELLPTERVSIKKGLNKFRLRTVSIVNPLLWWPNGHGNPNLYKMTLKLSNDGSNYLVDERHIGLRKVRLLQPRDNEGRKFIIEINNKKIFSMGGNWIPCDAYIPRVQNEKVAMLVKDAAKANYNILRVWGGGVYESDFFYDCCDREGIMVMQDFPFACNIYPEEEEFVANIAVEVEQNLKRINGHPSLVLLSGNNECHEVYYNSIYQEDKNSKFHGRKIFEELLPDLCGKIIPDVPYTPGSPHSPDDPVNPSSPARGDRHAWQLGFGVSFQKYYWNMTEEKGRFISEFGYLGMPPYSTVKDFMKDCDTSRLDHPFLHAHENKLVPLPLLIAYSALLYPIPGNLNEYCYVSMLAQAEMLRFAVEHFRRRKFNCAGSIIWQFNDAWPAPSWSAIDWFGRKKAHYYYMKRAYSPLIVSFEKVEDEINIWAVNELDEIKSCELRIFRCDGQKLENIVDTKFDVPENSSELITTVTNSFDWERQFLVAEIRKNKKVIAKGNYFGVLPKFFRWPEKNMIISVNKMTDTKVRFELVSDIFLKDVYCHVDSIDPDAIFEDNFIDIYPGDKKEFVVKTSKPFDIAEIRKALSVSHVNEYVNKYQKV